MKKAILTILQYIIFLGLGIWVVYHMLHELTPTQTTELVDAIKSIDAWFLIPIFIAGFLSHLFRALRWQYLLETMEMRPTVTNTMFAVMIGYLANLALPRAGEVAKCTVLAKYEKMPAHKMIGTIVAERAFDVVCLLTIAVFSFLVQINTISSYVSGKMNLLSQKIEAHENVLLAFLVLGIAGFVALFFVYRRHRETKFGRILKEMSHGIFSIIHMKKRWQFMGYTVLMWLMYVLQIYIGLKSLPPTHHLTMLAALVVLVYGSVGLIITPGGIGMYTLMVAQILVVYDIPDIPAQAFGWIAWAVQTVLIIVLGIISLLSIHGYNRIRDEKAAMDLKQTV
jgi:glycosyltransferase 2 family protein